MSYAQRYIKPLDRLVERLPLVVLEARKPIEERMKKLASTKATSSKRVANR